MTKTTIRCPKCGNADLSKLGCAINWTPNLEADDPDEPLWGCFKCSYESEKKEEWMA